MKFSNAMSLFNGMAKGEPGPFKSLLCSAIQNENRGTLIEQSYILIKQSVDQVLPYQRTKFGYATVLLLSVNQVILHLTALTIDNLPSKLIAVKVG